MNTKVNVPAVMKNNQMKNPITCAVVDKSIVEVYLWFKNRKNPITSLLLLRSLLNRPMSMKMQGWTRD